MNEPPVTYTHASDTHYSGRILYGAELADEPEERVALSRVGKTPGASTRVYNTTQAQRLF